MPISVPTNLTWRSPSLAPCTTYRNFSEAVYAQPQEHTFQAGLFHGRSHLRGHRSRRADSRCRRLHGTMRGAADGSRVTSLRDAIFFHFFDMLVIGILITLAGFVESLRFQRVFSSTMLVIQGAYLYLDLQTSDTPFGNALYKGPNSVAPVVIGLLFTVIFLLLTISALRYRVTPENNAAEHDR